MTELRVLLVDDDPLVRAGLRMMLDGHVVGDPGDERTIRVVGEAADGDEVPDAVAAGRPHVVLMDLRMPRCNGVVATDRLRRTTDPPAVVVLTTFDADEHVLGALRAGASGFLLKASSPTDIVAAVRTAADGEPVLSPSIARRLIALVADGERSEQRTESRRRLAQLAEREREVAEAVARGLSNAEIASELHMGIGTVKAYVSRVLQRLGLDNRVQIALLVRGADP